MKDRDMKERTLKEISDKLDGIVEQAEQGGGMMQFLPHATKSGSVVSFESFEGKPIDSLKVTLTPTQDLHGYDSPWPAGGGVNILDPNLKFTTQTVHGVTLTTSNGYEFSITGTGESGAGNLITNTINLENCIVYPAGTYTAYGMIIGTYHTDGSWYSNRYGTFTSSEDFIIKNGYREIGVGTTYNISDFISLVKGSTAPTEWTPYSNLCPITGTDAVEVVREGKNLCPVAEESGNMPLWGADVSGMVAFLNTLPAGTYRISNKYKIVTMPSNSTSVYHGGLYVTAMVNGSQQPVNLYSVAMDSSPSVGKIYTEDKPLVITEAQAGNINHCYYYCDSSVHTSSGRGKYKCYDIQVEVGTEATPYTPFDPQSTTLPIEWGAVGKNQFDIAERVLNQTKANGTATDGYTLNNGVLSISKDVVNYGRVMLSAMPMKAGTYTLSFAWTASGSGRISYSIRNMGADPKVDIVGSTGTTTASVSQTFTLDTDANVAISIQPEGSATGTMSITNIMLNTGSSALPYEPFTKTIYGGHVDAVRGEITVDRAMVDLGTLNYSQGFSGFYTTGLKTDVKIPSSVANSGLLSDIYVVGNTASSDQMYIQTTGSYVGWIVILPSTSYASASDFKTAMSGHQLCYELATPITIPLDPQTLKALRNNTVWSDAGPVDVTYLSSIQDYIDNAIQEALNA